MPSISAALIEAARTKDSTVDLDEHSNCRSRFSLWRCSGRGCLNFFVEQFYPHHLKMMVLFVIAALHLAYTREFLSTFRAYESLVNQVEYRASPGSDSQGDINLVRFVMIAFVDYKKNLWMTVGAMCASLSTSAIILFFYNSYWSQMSRVTKAVVCVVDMLALLSLPFLLGARLMIATNLTTYIEPSLHAASRLVSTSGFMNELKCSIIARESLPLCSVVLERSIFPVLILKYLIVLCVLTAAYIMLAYLIEYCIRHWFPPSDRDEVMQRARILVETA
uniref:G protein-coupled receptor n=1 Tax=Haemonchus contortus TaxID=6289 RepID=A0A7I4Y4B3_HAECO